MVTPGHYNTVMSRPRTFLPLMLPLFLLASCASGTGRETLPTTDPSIRGAITRVSPDEPRTVLVEENPGEESGSNKASVRLMGETRLLRRSGEAVQRAAPADLAVGQTVSVWFTGPVRESFPVQADAGTIVIEGGPES
jgi:beta-N-acetylhexosaminidase